MITFDVESHTYRDEHGRVLPSVTQVLSPLSANAYRGVPQDVMDAAAAIGTAVHRMIELDVQGVLDESSLHPSIAQYLPAWRRFLVESRAEILGSEMRVASRRYGFAGTLDLYLLIHGQRALIDAKRVAQVQRTTGPQTAGYEIALREETGLPATTRIDRYALQLVDDKFRLIPLTDPADQRVFLAALTVHNWSAKAA